MNIWLFEIISLDITGFGFTDTGMDNREHNSSVGGCQLVDTKIMSFNTNYQVILFLK